MKETTFKSWSQLAVKKAVLHTYVSSNIVIYKKDFKRVQR